MTKEEAIKICKQVRKYFKGGKLATDDTDAIYGALTEAIEVLKEQKTGHWQKYEGRFDYNWECSECGCSSYEKTDWCAHCGARMECEEE